jgi:hypothetical protein
MSASDKKNGDSGTEPETVKAEEHTPQLPDEGDPIPLFLRDSKDGQKGNAQDEKDEMGE